MATSMRTQKAEILNWLQRIGYITPKDAIALCGCYRLAARISELRAEGWMIVTEKSRIKGAHRAVHRLIDDKKMTEEERQNGIYR